MKKTLLVFVMALVVTAFNASSVPAAEKASAFPPAPPKVSPIEGAIDFHVHSAPDVFGRNVNDLEVARAAARAGMRALVLKNHITTTADRAALVSSEVPGIEVFGGIVLNKAVGAEHFILSTDLGQSGNPIHPDGYKRLVTGLKKAGVSQSDLNLMMRTNPARLLGIE